MGDVAAPAPAGFLHAGGEDGGVAVEQRVAALGELVEQGGGEVGEAGDFGFQADRRLVVVERHGEAARGRRGGMGGADEGEQVEQVEGGAGAHAEAPEGGGGVDEDGRWEGFQQVSGFGGGQQQEFAVRCQDGGPTVARDHGGRVGQRY